MKILVINYEFPPLGGGAGPVSYELARNYVTQGHEVDVITMHYKNLPRYEVVEGINIYRVKSIRKRKEICSFLELFSYIVGAFFFLRKHLKNKKYDINHTHFLIPSGVVSLWIKKKFNINYIVTPHGSDVPGYNEDRFHFLHLFTKPILRQVCRNASKIVFPSNYLFNLALKKISQEIKSKSIKIPNGINPDIFSPTEKKPIILATGRLLPRKGFQHLIQALSDEDMGYELHICGDGPMRNELEKLAEKSQTKVIFHGWIDNEGSKYKKLLSEASIYALVSSKENASISLLEAMSAGCAIVTSNVSGCPETVEDAGIVVEPGDIKAIKDAIKNYINDKNYITKMQKRSREKIIEQYHWKKLTNNYLTLLEEQS